MMPLSSLWLLNSTSNLMMLFVLALHVLRTAFGVIFLTYFSLYYVFLYYFVCFIMYFIVHSAFVRIKVKMMMIITWLTTRLSRWSKWFDLRPRHWRTRIVQSYLPGGANISLLVPCTHMNLICTLPSNGISIGFSIIAGLTVPLWPAPMVWMTESCQHDAFVLIILI